MAYKALDVFEPSRPISAAVFSSPHSGRDYDINFLNQTILSPLALRASEDAFVDQLFDSAPRFGAPLLAARFPRAYVDANRAADEFDSALIEGVPPGRRTARLAAGLGVVPRVVAEGRPIYRGKLPLAEAKARVLACWRPYHQTLTDLLARARERFGYGVLFDVHSMPSELGRRRGYDVVLGDAFGAACDPMLSRTAARLFADEGFHVGRNAPFAGGYITRHYGRPADGIHALQIEIDRGIYLDEDRVAPSRDFEAVRTRLSRVAEALIRLCAPEGVGWLSPYRSAAE